jgi:2-polyprenyl-3-methyl-5-hydroxy-6-metoxy-1,4-benzoquinol methylase
MIDLRVPVDAPELMDTRTFPPPVVRRTLDFLSFTNRFCGGTAVVLSHLSRWSVRWKAGETIRILDVGTGAADIPAALVKWGRRNGFRISVTALEKMPLIAGIARERTAGLPEITISREDVFAFAPERPFDYVIASLFLHHIPPAERTRMLQRLDALCVRGMILSDLHRTVPAYAAVALLSRLIGNDVVRHDGPLSVRRAFRLRELNDLAAGGGLPYLRARHHAWFRLSLAGEKCDG